jgi:small multidrug resistance family-3 protein
MMKILLSIGIFVLAGLCEIGGGYLVWQWLREGKGMWLGLLGGIVLMAYGVVATFQTENFGRVYAAYGGIFIVMAILWGWLVDGVIPDKYDLIGGGVAFVGMAIIMFAPRT